jgi:subtilase family serine protease
MRKLIIALLAVLLSASVESQERRTPKPRTVGAPQSLPDVQHDTSPPLRDVAPIPPAPAAEEKREKRRPLHHHRGQGSGPRLPDPVVQTTPGTFSMPSAGTTFDGVDNVDGVLPPDPNGAVGPNHYVQWVNTSFAIFDKSGTLLYGPAAGNTLWSGFGGPCEEDNEGDPIVLHDHLADRWLMSQLALPNFPDGPFYQCVAVSQTADPTGAYNRYAFVVSDTKLNDYPKLAVWPDAYYLTVNQFDAVTSVFLGQGVLAFERDEMLAGRPARLVYFDLETVDPNLGGMLPADMDGPAPPAGSPAYFVQFDDDASGTAPQDQLELWRFHVDWSDPTSSTFTGPNIIPTAPFDSNMCGYSRNCIPQGGTRRRVDAISDRLMYRLQYRNFVTYETLVVNHTVDVGGDHAGIRWYEVRDPGGTPFIHQQGTYAPDALHRWMGSAAMDGAGDLAIGFSVSSATTFPSIRYAGRLVDDPLGTLPQGETTLMSGSGSQTDSTGRWGDYSALSVDPTDNCTFWYTQEYYSATSAIDWRTRIGSFQFPSCPSNLPTVTMEATVPTTPENGTTPGIITVRRTGSTDADLVIPYAVRGSATPGSDYQPLPGTVTIPAGATTATIAVVPIDDTLVENDETVMAVVSADPGYQVGTPSSATVTIINDDLPPDLVIATLSVPPVGGAGATITVADTTKNQGGGAAPASTTRFYLSTDATFDAGDVLLGGRDVPALPPGATSASSTAVTIPATTAGGTYWVIARADATGAVTEGDETNNTTSSPIVIGGDLTIAALSLPATGGAGLAMTVSDTTTNQGGGATPASTTRFYLSTNTTFDAGDVALGARAVPPLAPGGSSSGSTVVTVPPGTSAGLYYVIARADADNVVSETTETNNTSVRAVQIGPDLLVSTWSVPGTAAPGVAFAVSDTTANQGGGTAGASTTRFYLSTNALFDSGDVLLGSRAVPSLAPGATSTGSTTLTVPAGTVVGTYYILIRADADGVVGETVEANNTAAVPVQVGADLIVSAFTVPPTAGAGVAITVTDTTTNQGSGPAAASTTRFYLSTDPTFDAGDVALGGRAVPALAPGGASGGSTTLTVPVTTAPGTYYVIARADADGLVAETSESNNSSVRVLQIGPDLIVSSWSIPGTAAPGVPMTVSDTIRNQGGGTAGASTTRFYLSANALFDTADVPLGNRAVPALAPGASNAGPTTLTLPADIATGAYYILIVADADGAVGETVETNNTAAIPVQVGADLVVSAFTVPGTTGAGSAITVSDTTTNQGSSPTAASTTRFYLSTDSVLDASDVALGSRAVPALAPGGSSSGTTALTVPPFTTAGTWYLIARADADGLIAETSELNNTSVRTVQIGPDLVIATWTIPGAAAPGVPFTVSDTVRNQGGGAAGVSTTRFYLSSNAVLDASDVLLGSRSVPALAAGATSTGPTTLTLPADTAVGAYYILISADDDAAVAETVETNNTAAVPVQVGPDLIVSVLSVPATTGAGAVITVGDTTTNQGSTPAAASTVAFYLSTNTTLDAGDVLLGSRTVPALAAGGSSSGSTSVTVPPGTATGTWYLIARADADGVVAETNELNDTALRVLQVGPDLVVATWSIPATATAGGQITVADTTANQGGGAAGPSTTRFYLSTNALLDPGDVPLGSRQVPSLAPAATSAGSTSVTIPAGTPAGRYFVLIAADADGTVAETQEGNNLGLGPIQVAPGS